MLLIEARLKYSVFSKRLKEVKHEMLEVMNCGKLFQTAGAACVTNSSVLVLSALYT